MRNFGRAVVTEPIKAKSGCDEFLKRTIEIWPDKKEEEETFNSVKVPAHPHRCFHVFWLIRPLLRLKLGGAMPEIRWYHQHCPVLAGATKLIGERASLASQGIPGQSAVMAQSGRRSLPVTN